MRKLLIVAFAAGFAFTTQAQISTRENNESVVKLGARPTAGNMALQLGLNINQDNDINVVNSLLKGDLVAGKYYLSDDLVIRGGINLFKESTSLSGVGADSSFYNAIIPDNVLTNTKTKTSERNFILVPGIEKHFSNTNIFDVYAGGDLYLGLGKEVEIDEDEFASGDKSLMTSKTGTQTVGLGGVVGFNVFVAHLPVSLGLEYGWTGQWKFGGKTKVTREDVVGSDSYTSEYFTDGTAGVTQYSSLSKVESMLDANSNVRVVLNIYFAQ